MSKVYDPILCMLVDKEASKARDAYPHRVVENTGFNKSTHPFALQVKNALGWANAGTFKTKEEAEKAAKSQDSVVDRAIRAIDAEKGYELDGFWIKPNDYGVEVTKNGKKVGEFDSTSEAEKWIRGKYGD